VQDGRHLPFHERLHASADSRAVWGQATGAQSTEVSYFLSSLPPNARRIGRAIRGHWSIENGRHWLLDVVFREDARRVYERTAAQNVAVLNRLALSWLRGDISKDSMKVKRKRAGWSIPYLAQLLNEVFLTIKGEILPGVEHRQHRYLNNRAENSHQPTRQRERRMQRFKSPGHTQQFLSAFDPISQHFSPRRHRFAASAYRQELRKRISGLAGDHNSSPGCLKEERGKTIFLLPR
jgi:predicted transposase YbfD/YdcC